MEFYEKLQQLRKSKSLTQEELAAALFVSRTAISKWESGRGYPNIDSLKQLSKLFNVSIDSLLSGEDLLTIAEEDNRKKQNCFCSLVFGLLDISTIMFLFLPIFAQKTDDGVISSSLLYLTEISPYLKTSYIISVAVIVLYGIITIILDRYHNVLLVNTKITFSLVITTAATMLFIAGAQVYGAAFLFAFFIIKIIILLKHQ